MSAVLGDAGRRGHDDDDDADDDDDDWWAAGSGAVGEPQIALLDVEISAADDAENGYWVNKIGGLPVRGWGLVGGHVRRPRPSAKRRTPARRA